MRVTAYLQRLSRLGRIGQYQFWNEAKKLGVLASSLRSFDL
jgi:hypothetical protein